MDKRRLELYVAYQKAASKLGIHVLLNGDAQHPVNRAIQAMGFDRFRPHEPLAEVDHKIPLWAGGSDEDDNCQILCQPCHKEKTSSEAGQRKRLRGRPWSS